jgi:hypothetical protein
MRIRSSLVILVLLTIGLVACDSSGLDDADPDPAAQAVYVANQGNFGDGNGSVSVYDPANGTVDPAAVSSLNSIVQSLAVDDGALFVVANTGGRVDVFATPGLSQTAQLTGFSGPRYVTTSGDRAFVTDQPPFGSSRPSQVRVIDRSGDTPVVTDSIAVSGTADGITAAGDRVYAAIGAFGSSTRVAAINATDQSLINEIDVGCASRYVVADRDDEVFVLCSDTPEAVVLDGATGQERARIALPDTTETLFGIGQPASYSASAQELYVTTDTGIARINTAGNVLDTFLASDRAVAPTAVAYDAGREALYVGRTPPPPAGFTQQGTVTIHDRTGTATDTVQVGVAPAYIALQSGE